MDGVGAVEVLDGGAVADAEFVVEATDLGVFVVHPFVETHAVIVSALDHEGARGDEGGHLGIVERSAKVPLPNFILVGVEVAHWHVETDALADPLVEVARADRQAVVSEDGGDAHGGLAAVAEAVESDAVGIGEGLRFEPFEDALVLADDGGEEGASSEVELALEDAEGIPTAIGIVWGKGDKALLGQSQSEGFVGAPGLGGLVGFKAIGGQPFESVLADDDGVLFGVVEVLRQSKPAPGNDAVPDIENDFVDGDGFGFANEASAWIHRDVGIGKSADDVIPEPFALSGHALLEGREIHALEGLPERLGPFALGGDDLFLSEVLERVDEAGLAFGSEGCSGKGRARVETLRRRELGKKMEEALGERGGGGEYGKPTAGGDGQGLFGLGLDRGEWDGCELTRSGGGALTGLGFGSAFKDRRSCVANDEGTGSDAGGDFGVIESVEEIKEGAVERFLPGVAAWCEGTGNKGFRNAILQSSRGEGNAAAFTDSCKVNGDILG